MIRRLSLVLFALVSSHAFAQLKLPALSLSAKVSGTAGLTDVSVDYSSPAVKGRKIWGALVPYDKVWRAGANKATSITFSQPVMVGTTEVPAGTYAFFAIPGQASWTLIINKGADQWGSTEYKQELDVARVTVKPQAIPNRERLTYILSNASNDSVSIDLEWEKVRVSLPVKLKTAEQAEANITAAGRGAWRPMNEAARYYLEGKEYAKGLEAIEKSIAVQETWSNTWVKAQLLAGSGKYKDAMAAADKAQSLGQAANDDIFTNFYAADMKKAQAEWKGK